MTEAPENVVLVYPRRIDEKVDGVVEDVRDVKLTMISVEERLAGLEQPIAGVNRRIDRVELRLDRVEKRLDPVELPK